MKWRLFIGLVIICLVGGWFWDRSSSSPTPPPSPSPAKTGSLQLAENEDKLRLFSTPFGDFRAAWEIVPPEAKVRVGVNQDLEYSGDQLQEQLNCRVLTSGAFYDVNGDPLGLLVSQGATLSAWRNSQLLHGLIGREILGGRYKVLGESEDVSWDWAVQAGPVVWFAGEPVRLSLTADQAARRVVAGVTPDNQLVLVVIVANDSLYLGPTLTSLPQVLAAWQEAVGINLISGLNLDGGTASTFISPTFKLKELKPIGSYICVD